MVAVSAVDVDGAFVVLYAQSASRFDREAALKTIPVDPEARERLETELIQDIFELGKEGGTNGQDGTTL